MPVESMDGRNRVSFGLGGMEAAMVYTIKRVSWLRAVYYRIKFFIRDLRKSNVVFVNCTHGSDDNDGMSPDRAFASIAMAATKVTGNGVISCASGPPVTKRS